MAVVGCIWFIYVFLYQTQFQSYQKVIVALVLTGNNWSNDDVVNYIIVSYVVLYTNLRTVLLVCDSLCNSRASVHTAVCLPYVRGLEPVYVRRYACHTYVD